MLVQHWQVTWGPNPFSKHYYVKQPLTVTEAKNEGFTQISTQCNGTFLGQRFIKGNDIGVILIYDIRGTLAGVQMALPVSMAKRDLYKFDTVKMFNRDIVAGIDAYVLTAYFVDPRSICGSGRDAALLKIEGMGTGLWLQNGSDPIINSVQAPLYENNVNTTKWVKGSCFPSMGMHYWYDNRVDKECDEIFPVFLLYNKGKLTGLGWGLAGKYEYSNRTEPVPYNAVSSFMRIVPTCLKSYYDKVGGFTSIHLYFNTAPWNLLC
ncbi:hypothetical protein I4U23_011347 [Adineta vaga]|nr:hypothetical protein I4U23_011347 [Adineta vaga]